MNLIKKLKLNYVQLILLIIAIIQLLFIVYMNFFSSSGMIDYDGAKLYKHAIEMWENKTLFIPDWKYITTMELDCSLLFAVPIYGLTRNIFFSFACSNLLFLILYIVVIYSIFKQTSYSKYALLAINLLLIPYATGMLEYFNMMFFNGSQYVVKVLLPLLFILLLITKSELQWKVKNIFFMIVYGILLLISSLSSGLYVMLCGIIPIILCALIDFFHDGSFIKYKKYHIVLCMISFAAFLLGTVLGKLSGITARGNQMLLTKAENFKQNFEACILGIFQSLNSVPTNDSMILSMTGIIYLLRILLILVLLFVCFYNIKNLFVRSNEIPVKKFLACLFPWNLLILIFADTRYSATNTTIEYRYYFIALIPLFLLFAMEIGEWLEKKNSVEKHGFTILILLAVLASAIGSNKLVLDQREISQYANDICNYIDSLDQEIESVFFIPDEQTPEMCRLIDESRTYSGYHADNGLVVYDYYQSAIDRASHGASNLIFVYNWETPDMYLPAYISNKYEKIGEVRWYHVYYASENMFDSMSGFPAKDQSIDFFYSPGYSANPSNSFINDSGLLEVTGNGEEAVNSGVLPAVSGKYNIELSYESDASSGNQMIGVIEIQKDGIVMQSVEIPQNGSSVKLEDIIADNDSLSIHIKISAGVTCRLKQITFSHADSIVP